MAWRACSGAIGHAAVSAIGVFGVFAVVVGCGQSVRYPRDNGAAGAGVETGAGAAGNGANEAGGAGSSASGAGGGDGSVPAPAGCAQDSFVKEDVIARATAVFTSCFADDGFWRTQLHLRETQGGFTYATGRDVTFCLAAVTKGCEQARACVGLSFGTRTEQCNTCQGNVAVLCEPTSMLWDCTRLGGTCKDGRCELPGRESCAEDVNETCSADGRPQSCDEFVNRGPVCEKLGLVCDDTFYASCRGTGKECGPAVSPYPDVNYRGISCAGDRLTACVGGRTADLRCECFGEGFSCQAQGPSTFCGSAADCDPRTFEKTCDGDTVVFCNGGKLTRIACPSLGLARCSVNPRIACLD